MKRLLFILAILLAAPSLRATAGNKFDPPLPPDPGAVYELTLATSIPEAATLTGAGLYPENHTVTINCLPHEGYRFDYWSANGERLSTSPSYTLPMPAQDMHLTAHLTALSLHTLTVNTNIDTAAVVTGQGTYFAGDIVPITCTTHEDYTFQHWTLDGTHYSNKQNHTFTMDDNAHTLTAICQYTPVSHIRIMSSNTKAGTVSTSGGTYAVGHVLTIQATPKTEYTFSHWELNGEHYSDVATIHYTITEQDVELVAKFSFSPAQPDDPAATMTSTIYLQSEPQQAAKFNIASGLRHNEGDTLYLSAQLQANFVLDGWYINDQCVSNTLELIYIVGRKDVTITLRATEIITYSLNLVSQPGGAVSFNRAATTHIKANETIQLKATINSQYTFDGWYEADSLISRSLTITYQMPNRAVTLIAKATTVNPEEGFDPTPPAEPALEKVHINAYANNAAMGKVVGSAMHVVGDTITLEAIPTYGHEFVRWSDGDINAVKTIIVTEALTLIAHFTPLLFTIQASANDNTMGTVTGSGQYPYHSYQTISAKPNSGYEFVKWSDGTTEPVYTLFVEGDSTIVAEFQEKRYQVTAYSSNPTAGTVTGSDAYRYGDTATITAIPNTGYNFVQWEDGNTNASRQIVVTGNCTLVAYFAIQQLQLTLSSEDPTMGYVIGEGVYDYGTELTIQAIPNPGHKFLQWSNGITDNPYTFVITAHTHLTASFIEYIDTGIDDIHSDNTISNAQKIIYNGQLIIIRDGKTYNIMGQEIGN